MISFSIQFYWMVGGAVVVFFIILAFSGICKTFGAFSLDINKNLNDLNDIVVDCQQKFTVRNRIEIFKRFYAIVEFHSNTKQLSFNALCIALVTLSINTFLQFGFLSQMLNAYET